VISADFKIIGGNVFLLVNGISLQKRLIKAILWVLLEIFTKKVNKNYYQTNLTSCGWFSHETVFSIAGKRGGFEISRNLFWMLALNNKK